MMMMMMPVLSSHMCLQLLLSADTEGERTRRKQGEEIRWRKIRQQKCGSDEGLVRKVAEWRKQKKEQQQMDGGGGSGGAAAAAAQEVNGDREG